MMKKIIYLLIIFLFVIAGNNSIFANTTGESMIKLLIDNMKLEVDWEQNASVNQLAELVKKK